MSEIIFESNKGTAFEKTVYKNGRCKVELRSTDPDHALCSMTYHFKNVPIYESPYLRWENLLYVASNFDDPYLYTAVQRDKKLYSDIVFTMFDEDWAKECPHHNLTTQKDVEEIIEKIKSELPFDCTLGSRGDEPRYRCRMKNIFICKNGMIADFIDIDKVLLAYEQLGIIINDVLKRKIKSYCHIPLICFSEKDAPFNFVNTQNGVELIVTGLILGYPIESTAWLLERDRYFG
jgi:hypothetical protein